MPLERGVFTLDSGERKEPLGAKPNASISKEAPEILKILDEQDPRGWLLGALEEHRLLISQEMRSEVLRLQRHLEERDERNSRNSSENKHKDSRDSFAEVRNSEENEKIDSGEDEFDASDYVDLWPIWEHCEHGDIPMSPKKSEGKSGSRVLDNPGALAAYNGALAPPRPRVSLADSDKPTCWIDNCVVDPTGGRRLCWDLLSLFFVVYDMVTLPLMAFSFDNTALSAAMRFITMVFWTLDIFASLVTGIALDDGTIQMRFRHIVLVYLKSRFIFDAGVSGIDWLLFFGDKGSLAVLARIGKSARMTRILRLFRLMRLVRLRSLLDRLDEHVVSRTLFLIFNIARVMFCVMVASHYFACGWYGVAVLGNEDARGTWANELEVEGASMFDRYLASSQWALAQFTPRPTQYRAVNTRERLYSLAVLFFGLIVFTVLIGKVSALISQASAAAFKQLNAAQTLRAFLMDNNVSSALSREILFFYKDKGHSPHRQLEVHATMLRQLPRHLREELHIEVHYPVLEPHLVFLSLASMHRLTMIHVCHSAAREVPLAKGDEPFFFSKEGTCMLFPVSGTLDYYAGQTKCTLRFMEKPEVLQKGTWTTEAPLWVHWEHRGLISVHDHCDVLELDSYRFRKVIARHRVALPTFQRYASAYAKALAQSTADGCAVNDLWGTPSGPSNGLLEPEVIEGFFEECRPKVFNHS